MTKKYKIENYDRTARERDTFMLALNDVLNSAVQFSGWHKESDSLGKYRVGVSRLDAADGGVMMVTYRHPGQGDYTTVYNPAGTGSIGCRNMALVDAIRDAQNTWHDSRAASLASGRAA